MEADTDTSPIREWRSIVTLVVFVLTNLVVLFPFYIPVYLPRPLTDAALDALSALRITSPRPHRVRHPGAGHDRNGEAKKPFVRLNFPMNFVTAPLIADLFLLAIGAIGRKEVHDGTIGADNISPIDTMVFFITLAYIAISIDASGLIRYLAFRVLQWGGEVGHRLFFYLYVFFFALGSFIGNDPIILSGTAFLAYMTRVSSNIVHPRAWIHTQFAVANIASAILVSSNPTNLVLAGAFRIRFIDYTANMIVPVVVTAIVLLPSLLYIIFATDSLIPYSIKMHEIPEEARTRPPVNPNIPNARGNAEEEENNNDEHGKLLSLEEIMNPFLDKRGAAFGAIIMAVTLITVLALNAASTGSGEHPVFWVTLPAAFVTLCWDVTFGWLNREKTREIAREGRKQVELARAERAIREEEAANRVAQEAGISRNSVEASELTNTNFPQADRQSDNNDISGVANLADADDGTTLTTDSTTPKLPGLESTYSDGPPEKGGSTIDLDADQPIGRSPTSIKSTMDEKNGLTLAQSTNGPQGMFMPTADDQLRDPELNSRVSKDMKLQQEQERATLVSVVRKSFRWSQETFPTATAVIVHLPLSLVVFGLTLFVLVQALVSKGWVPLFAYGWDHWVNKTGTIGSIGGMAFISVILCNFAGTNIGATILLSRILQSWVSIHEKSGVPISERTFWAAVYSMALGVNYGAFSTAFSASLAGLLWRDILARKHIHVRRLEFARVNLPIIAISMVVGCAVLIGEVYIMRDNSPYVPPS